MAVALPWPSYCMCWDETEKEKTDIITAAGYGSLAHIIDCHTARGYTCITARSSSSSNKLNTHAHTWCVSVLCTTYCVRPWKKCSFLKEVGMRSSYGVAMVSLWWIRIFRVYAVINGLRNEPKKFRRVFFLSWETKTDTKSKKRWKTKRQRNHPFF